MTIHPTRCANDQIMDLKTHGNWVTLRNEGFNRKPGKSVTDGNEIKETKALPGRAEAAGVGRHTRLPHPRCGGKPTRYRSLMNICTVGSRLFSDSHSRDIDRQEPEFQCGRIRLQPEIIIFRIDQSRVGAYRVCVEPGLLAPLAERLCFLAVPHDQ